MFSDSKLSIRAYFDGDTITLYEDEILNLSNEEATSGYVNYVISETIDTSSVSAGVYKILFEERDIYEDGSVTSRIVVSEWVTVN